MTAALDPTWLEELSAVLRIPSVSADPEHQDDVVRAAEWVRDFVRAAGGECELVRGTSPRPLVIGELRASQNAESVPLPEEAAEVTLRKETLEKILSQLSQRERKVLELRYGLNGEHPRTLDEVGRAFNVTRERIRQIENQSLKKLRALAESQKLRDVA